MSLAGYHIRSSHLKLIAVSHIRNSLRSGSGVIFLVVSMLLGVMLAGGFGVLPFELVAKQKGAEYALNELIKDYGPKVLGFVTDTSHGESMFLLATKPAMISLFLIVLILLVPYFSMLSAFNQTSGDIGSKGLRYLLLRTERANVFLGRLIGTYLFTVAVISIIVFVTGFYVLIKVDLYPAGDIIPWLLRGWLACCIFVLPWVALCAWISASMDSPFLSLLITLGGLGFWVIIIWIMKGKAEEAGYAAYLTPWGFKWWLLHSNIGILFAGIAVMLGFTALFTFLGLRTFHRRDV